MPTLASEVAGLIARLAWLGLIHAGWIGLLVAGVVALAFQAIPRLGPRGRHRALIAAMGIVAVGPIAAAVGHELVSEGAERPAMPGEWIIGRVEMSEASDADRRAPAPVAIRPLPRTDRPAFVPKIIAGAARILDSARPVLLTIWASGVAVLGSILLVGAIGLRRTLRRAVLAPDSLARRARRWALRLGMRGKPRVLTIGRPVEPFVCGILRPTIVLPADWIAQASSSCVDAVLAHELAHARRRDPIVNLAQRILEVALFFHPAVRWISRSLRRDRERCADAFAVAITGNPMALAEALQSVARLRLTSPNRRVAGLMLGGPSVSLLPRIQELLGMTPTRSRFRLWPLAAIPAAGFLALVAAAAGFAGDSPSPVHHGSPFEVDTNAIPAAVGPNPFPLDRQISYEVRLLVGPAERWREHLLPKLRPIREEADLSAWMIDEAKLRELAEIAQQDARTNLLSAPKVTAFDGARATIMQNSTTHYVAALDDVERPEMAGFRPVVKKIRPGITVNMTGKLTPTGTKLSIDLRDLSLLGFHTITRRREIRGQVIAAQYQIPSTSEHRLQLDRDLPDGTGVLISLGVQDAPGPVPGGVAMANRVLGSVGLPPYEATPITMERLILITPRRIIPEAEEGVGVPPSPKAKPAT